MRLLLLSNSTMPGEPWLGWARPHLDRFLADAGEILFLPFAAADFSYDEYTARLAGALPDRRVVGAHTLADPAASLARARALVAGGGNTFCLLRRCQDLGLLGPMRAAVEAGARFAGWSAGANLACPTIKTTNDMPIVETAGLDALGLVPFQINPHFTEATIPGHGGESRAQRLREFVQQNPGCPVLALPEGMFVEVDGQQRRLGGAGEALWFTSDEPPRSLQPGPLPC
ncbi:MAG: dipeptidase PepE [Candidatus Hydrogenedentes bacterium]|nr:dipeptidase PepE [Candidatus Hydrogenedentota bacterium]